MMGAVAGRRRIGWSPFVGLAIALLLWQSLAWLSGRFIVASPAEVVGYFSDNWAMLIRAAWITTKAAAIGFVWGNLAAIALAVIVFILPRAERLLTGLALLGFCLPLVATGPILRVLFGPGEGPQITLAALAVYYTTYLALLVGLRAIPQSWSDLVRSYGRGRRAELIHIRAMASLPYLIAGLQIAAPAAFLGAMVGEFTGAERGMGVLTIRAMRALDVPATWSLAILASGIAMMAYWAFGALGRRLTYAAPEILLSAPGPQIRASPWRGVGRLVLLVLVVLILWQGVMDAFDLNRFFAKRPGDVWDYLVTRPEAGANRAALLGAFGETLRLTAPGYLAGLIFGAGLAALLVVAPSLAVGVMPLAVALRSVPIVTTAPLIVLALGRGATGTITIVAVMIFFPTLVACLHGLRQTPGQVVDVFDSYKASRWRLLVSARIPAMWPAFFASARMAVPAALLAVTTTEWLATGRGIGNLMALTASTSNYNMLWSSIVVLAGAAGLAYAGVGYIERAVLQRYAAEQMSR